MKHYLFDENISGERFIVGADNEEEATIIAKGIAKDIGRQWNSDDEWELEGYGEITEEEAEDSGLDEY